MFRWIPYTFVRTVLFFTGGILLGLYVPDVIGEKLSFILLVIFTVFYFLVVFFGLRIRHALNPGLIALPLVFLLGYIHLIRHTDSRDPEHLLHTDEPISSYKAVITSFSEEKARSWKIEARVLAIRTDKWQPKEAKVILYFSKQDFSDPFNYGDVLLIKGYPQNLQAPANPGELITNGFFPSKIFTISIF